MFKCHEYKLVPTIFLFIFLSCCSPISFFSFHLVTPLFAYFHHFRFEESNFNFYSAAIFTFLCILLFFSIPQLYFFILFTAHQSLHSRLMVCVSGQGSKGYFSFKINVGSCLALV